MSAELGPKGRREETVKKQRKGLECREDRGACSLSRGIQASLSRTQEKEMATHPSVLAWRIPWTRSLAGYSPCGCKEDDTTKGPESTENLSIITESCSPISDLQIIGLAKRIVRVFP